MNSSGVLVWTAVIPGIGFFGSAGEGKHVSGNNIETDTQLYRKWAAACNYNHFESTTFGIKEAASAFLG
jgi:hypothetical protein